ncbi:MAG TPA: phage tail protein [Gaiellaceae bacterium]
MSAVDPLSGRSSGYLEYLPAIFAEDGDGDGPGFLARYLLGFERVLTGLGDVDDPGLEEKLEGIPSELGRPGLAGSERYFEPGPELDDGLRAPADFLDWLGTWVALAFRGDLGDAKQREGLQRELIAKAVWLYSLRGTKDGLEQLLHIYTRMGVTVDELEARWQLGATTSTLGIDTYLDGGAPHFFRVTVRFPASDPRGRARLTELAQAIVDAEKPAHTHYDLEIQMNTMLLGVEGRSTLGVDTLLGATFSEVQ